MLGEKNIKKLFKEFPAWLVIFYYLANLYRMTDNSAIPYIVLTSLTGVYGLYQMFINKKLNRMFLFFVFIIYVFMGFLNYAFIGNEKLGDIASDVLVYGITIVMLSYPVRYIQGFAQFYITVAFFFFSFQAGELTHYLLTSSGNFISVLLILSATLYYIGVYNSGKNLSLVHLLPPLFCFPLSVWALGRGGIISTAIMLLLALFGYVQQKKEINPKIYKRMIPFLIIGVVLLIIYGSVLVNEFLSLGKLGYQGFDTPRPYMWGKYVDKMLESPFYILLGAPLDEIWVIYVRGNNMHNSFFQLHALNGLIVFVGFVYLTYRSFKNYLKKREWILLIILITMIVRGMTDKFIFGQYGMPIMLYLVFYPFAYAQKNKLAKVKLKQDGKRV